MIYSASNQQQNPSWNEMTQLQNIKTDKTKFSSWKDKNHL